MPRKTRMNDLTSPELLAQVNPENLRLKNDFLNYLRSVQRSEGTIAGYDNDLDIFFVWVMQHAGNKEFAKVSKRDLVSFQNWLINENGNSASRVRRIKSAISSMSNFIEAILDDEPEFQNFRSIVRKIESPVNQPIREKTVLTDEQVQALLDRLTEKKHYDKACLVALAVYSGRRKSELVRFRVDDFKDENLVCDGALYKTTNPIKTKGMGGGKYIYCYTFAKNFKPYFDRWMEDRAVKGIESEWLFPDKKEPHKQMSPNLITSWANTFSAILGVEWYAHSCRHYFTTYLVRAGLPDGVVQSILGWTSSDMVRVYTDIDADEQIGMYFKDGEICAPEKRGIADL